jgi:hypothetical protein
MTKDEILSKFFGGYGGGNFEILNDEQLADKEFILDLYKRGADINQLPLNKVSKELRADREVVIAVVKQEPLQLKWAQKSLRGDKEVVLAAIKKSFGEPILKIADESLNKDREVVLEAVKHHPFSLKDVDESFLSDHEVILLAYGSTRVGVDELDEILAARPPTDKSTVMELLRFKANFEIVAVNFMNDREVVELAIESNDLGYSVPDHILQDRAFNELNAKTRGEVIYGAPKDIINDRDIIMHAVKIKGLSALSMYANDSYKDYDSSFCNDKEIVLEAIKAESITVTFFEYVSKELRGDKEVALAALAKDIGSVYNLLSKELKADSDLLDILVKNAYSDDIQFEDLDDSLKQDNKALLQLLTNDSRYLESIDGSYLSLKEHRDIFVAAFASEDNSRAPDRWEFEEILGGFPEIVEDRELVELTLKADGGSLEHLPSTCQKDKELVRLAVVKSERTSSRNHGASTQNIEYASDDLKNDEELALLCADALRHLSDTMKNNEKVVRLALERGAKIEDVGEKLGKNKDIAMLAAENHRILFEDDFDSKLLNDKDLMLKLIENGCTKLADDFIPEKIRHDKALIEAVWSKYS